jgi:hypothetical protein
MLLKALFPRFANRAAQFILAYDRRSTIFCSRAVTTLERKSLGNAVERAYFQAIWVRIELPMSGGREEVLSCSLFTKWEHFPDVPLKEQEIHCR